MSDEKKYVTFRDLRAVAKPEPKQTSAETASTSISSDTSTTSSTSISPNSQSVEKQKRSIVAPERDFQRVPNSVTRQAIPEGLFRGKSKLVWDYLWSVSRGAI